MLRWGTSYESEMAVFCRRIRGITKSPANHRDAVGRIPHDAAAQEWQQRVNRSRSPRWKW